MTDLEKYELVNGCETIKALEKAIISFTDLKTGLIQGRRRNFDGIEMASKVRAIVEEDGWPNNLTREFGIRQQALYLKHYTKEKATLEDLGNLFNKSIPNTDEEV